MRRVTAAVIIENGRLLLARRGPAGSLPGLWELPGGKVEDGETLQRCLERELNEELRMDARAGAVIATTIYDYAHGSFEMLALETTRHSEFELRVHDAVSWVDQHEIGSLRLAPADIALVEQIVAEGHW